MLALDDLLNMVGDPFTALHQPCERFGTRRERRGVAFEQLKEVALLGKQALEPGEHTAYPRFLGYIIDNAGRPRDGRSAERRVGKACGSTCRSWWSPYP